MRRASERAARGGFAHLFLMRFSGSATWPELVRWRMAFILLTLFSLEAVFFFSSINTKKWYFGSSLSDGHSFFPFVGSKNGWWIPPNFSLFSASLSMVD